MFSGIKRVPKWTDFSLFTILIMLIYKDQQNNQAFSNKLENAV